MPAVTPVDPSVLPGARGVRTGAPRPVQSIVTAHQTFEGGGFPVHRPFPQPGADIGATDPFLMLDEMGPIQYGPGEAMGAPDHPHRGFETVTYLLRRRDGTPRLDRRRRVAPRRRHAVDDRRRRASCTPRMPTAAMLRDGGLMHGLQLWVNLPRADKLTPPRYQDLSGDKLTLARSVDGTRLLRLVAGELGGQSGPGSTHTPIVYAHATIEASGQARARVAGRLQRARLRVARAGAGRRRRAHRRRAPARGARPRRRHASSIEADEDCRRVAARRSSAARAGCLVRPVRDEHEAGDPRLARPVRERPARLDPRPGPAGAGPAEVRPRT